MRIAILSAVIVLGSWAPVVGQDPEVYLDVRSWTGEIGNEIEVPILLTNDLGDLQGWSFGVAHDPAVLDLLSVETGMTTATAGPSGGPPTFYSVTMLSDGFVVGALLSSHGVPIYLPVGVDYELEVPHYEIITDPTGSEVCPSSALGSPPVATVATHQGAAYTFVTSCGAFESGMYTRGDCNADLTIDLADAIYVELYLFLSGEVPGCLQACDTNDDGQLDIADSIYLLNYLFVGGSTPPAPFVACGLDQTPDSLTCDMSVCP